MAIIKLITTCSNCPFFRCGEFVTDWCRGLSTEEAASDNKWIYDNEKEPPVWCPLRKKAILVVLKAEGE